MNIMEMSRLLATVSLIDPRVSRRDDAEKELMAKAWLVVVGDEVDYSFAAKCAQEHYKTSTDVFMPVHIVSKWKQEYRKEAEKRQLEAISDKTGLVGMPDDVRAKFVEMGVFQP